MKRYVHLIVAASGIVWYLTFSYVEWIIVVSFVGYVLAGEHYLMVTGCKPKPGRQFNVRMTYWIVAISGIVWYFLWLTMGWIALATIVIAAAITEFIKQVNSIPENDHEYT